MLNFFILFIYTMDNERTKIHVPLPMTDRRKE